MRKTAKTIVLLTMIFVMAISVGMMAMGCEIGGGGDGNSSSKTIYYQYNDNVKNPNDWICFEKDKWSDSDGLEGRLETDGDKFRAYATIFGEEDVMFYGIVSNGVLKWTLGESFGVTIYYNYYSDDCTVSDKDSAGKIDSGTGSGNGGNDSNNEGNQPPEDGRTKYTVSFDSMDGSEVASIEVGEGDLVAEPTQPIKIACDFVGWYKENDYINIFDFEVETITDNITLYAKWDSVEEMAAFDYTSTATTCTITGLKDNLIRSITIPDYVTSIGDGAFYVCANLTSITIPDGVTSIGNSAFYFCMSLTSITIPNSVTSIGDNAFYSCEMLTSVTIGNGVTSIGRGVFSGCDLDNIYVDEGNETYHVSGNCLIETQSKLLVAGCNNSIIPIDGSVTSIGDRAFYKCSSLTSITIPDGVTSIGNSAFCFCSSLTSITIPNSVTSIGSGAFSGCDLDNIYVDEGNENYHVSGNCLIETQSKLLVAGCNNSIIPIDGSVTSIGESAFKGCDGLTSITIPDSVTSIGDEVFQGCNGLTNITIPNSVTSIGESAFKGCDGLTSITIPNGVTSIGNGTFFACYSLTSVTIGNGVTSIGDSAFVSCYSLTSIIIPDRVTNIGDGTFISCSSLTSITIPDSVTSIGDNAFFYCVSLIEVYNKSSLNIVAGSEEYGYVGYYAKNVYTEEGGSKLSTDEDGYVIYADGEDRILVKYTGGDTDLTLPSDISEINEWAFTAYISLTSITIPNSVTSIGDYAFFGCSGLTSITFQGTIEQWNAISKGSNWNSNTDTYTIYCTDGNISK